MSASHDLSWNVRDAPGGEPVKRRLRSSGQAMVEYALVLPVFFMLTIGVVDFGRAILAYNTVSFLARDGARYGLVPTHGSSAILAYVSSRCAAMLSNTCDTPPVPSPLPANAAGISVTRGSCGSTSSPVVVTVTYAFQPASLMIANLWGGGTLPLQATSQMYVESATTGGCAS
jgi:Flp pilus assembly protein TadG